mgnify:CR=1 FL=1|tara:strand:+ start:20653 stop:21555 length:903 start_codon:yes stop_codon:yes gene_type:complete
MKRFKALVTGGTGFIGSHLVESLLNDGLETHIIIRTDSNLDVLDRSNPSLHIHIYDGTTSNIINIFKKNKPDIVFHLASTVISEHTSNDIESIIKSNILLGAQILEAMHVNDIDKLINTSTFWQNYNNDDYNPVCLYAATKEAFENIIRYYVEINSLKVINLKLFDTYGPNDKRGKLFTILRNAVKKNKTLDLSPGEQLIDLVYIDDVINAFRVSAVRLFEKSSKIKLENFVVSSGYPLSLKTIVSKFYKSLDEEVNINWGGKKYKDRQVMTPWNKGKILPNWEPSISLADGIDLVIDNQ